MITIAILIAFAVALKKLLIPLCAFVVAIFVGRIAILLFTKNQALASIFTLFMLVFGGMYFAYKIKNLMSIEVLDKDGNIEVNAKATKRNTDQKPKNPIPRPKKEKESAPEKKADEAKEEPSPQELVPSATPEPIDWKAEKEKTLKEFAKKFRKRAKPLIFLGKLVVLVALGLLVLLGLNKASKGFLFSLFTKKGRESQENEGDDIFEPSSDFEDERIQIEERPVTTIHTDVIVNKETRQLEFVEVGTRHTFWQKVLTLSGQQKKESEKIRKRFSASLFVAILTILVLIGCILPIAYHFWKKANEKLKKKQEEEEKAKKEAEAKKKEEEKKKDKKDKKGEEEDKEDQKNEEAEENEKQEEEDEAPEEEEKGGLEKDENGDEKAKAKKVQLGFWDVLGAISLSIVHTQGGQKSLTEEEAEEMGKDFKDQIGANHKDE